MPRAARRLGHVRFLSGKFMTYCVAISVGAGMVFCSDSRTNAGVDQISTYSKMFRYDLALSGSSSY